MISRLSLDKIHILCDTRVITKLQHLLFFYFIQYVLDIKCHVCVCVCALRFGWDDVRRFHLTCFLSQIIFCTSVWHFKGINLPTVKMTVNDYYCHRSSFTNMAIFDKIKSINLTYTHKCAISSELKRKKM